MHACSPHTALFLLLSLPPSPSPHCLSKTTWTDSLTLHLLITTRSLVKCLNSPPGMSLNSPIAVYSRFAHEVLRPSSFPRYSSLRGLELTSRRLLNPNLRPVLTLFPSASHSVFIPSLSLPFFSSRRPISFPLLLYFSLCLHSLAVSSILLPMASP